MIELNAKEYCKNCTEFEPETQRSRKSMIKLEDILLVACCNVSIMSNIYSVMVIDCKYDTWKYFSRDFLDREVRRIDTYDDRVRVWLKEEVTNKND